MEMDGMTLTPGLNYGYYTRSGRQYLDPADLKEAEIDKRPGAGGLAGSIRLRSKDPEDYLRENARTGGEIRGGYDGENDDISTGASIAARLDDRNSASLSYNPLDGRSNSLNGKWQYRPNDAHRLKLTLQHYDVDNDSRQQQRIGTASRGAGNILDSRNDRRNVRNAAALRHDIEQPTALFDRMTWQIDAQRSSKGRNTNLIPSANFYDHDDYRTRQYTLKTGFEKSLGGADGLALEGAAAYAKGKNAAGEPLMRIEPLNGYADIRYDDPGERWGATARRNTPGTAPSSASSASATSTPPCPAATAPPTLTSPPGNNAACSPGKTTAPSASTPVAATGQAPSGASSSRASRRRHSLPPNPQENTMKNPLSPAQHTALHADLARQPGQILENLAAGYGVSLEAVLTCLPDDMRSKNNDDSRILDILAAVATWEHPVTFIVHIADLIAETSGRLPPGRVARGYYNFDKHAAGGIGGHLKYQNCAAIYRVERPFMGTATAALYLMNHDGGSICKIFAGRDSGGSLRPEQVEAMRALVP